MASFTAQDVKRLREMTNVGMMDCKKALTEADGDFDMAIEWLREKGKAASVKKAGKVAAEGVSYAAVINGVGVVIEVNSQTDFVAKNEIFQGFVRDLAAVVAEQNPADVEALKAATYPGTDRTVADVTSDRVLAIGENLQIRRFVRYAEGVSVPYVHQNGKVGVLVNLAVEGIDPAAVVELGKDVAMQICSMSPTYVSSDDVPAEAVEAEKAVQLAKALEEGASNTKIPAEKAKMIAENKVKGRMNNFFAEVCLLNQAFVKENKVTVGEHIKSVAKSLGGTITVTAFTRFVTGEGIEKAEENYADEVASLAGLK
ncbi:MAG: elongation factor Ts [Oscillospiraceae bacterium]|nr:elongation factor Ts [Oscillospiraceae bacterium]